MSKDEKEVCLNCKWWKFDSRPMKDLLDYWLVQAGECHLAPPTIVQWGSYSEGLSSRTAWPKANGGNFCSAFKERSE